MSTIGLFQIPRNFSVSVLSAQMLTLQWYHLLDSPAYSTCRPGPYKSVMLDQTALQLQQLHKRAAASSPMSAISLSLGLAFLAVAFWPRLRRFFRTLQVPGPLLPRGIKGNLVDFMAHPRTFGPSMVAKYGPLYRVYTNNCGALLAIGDPVLAQQLYQDQANMAKPLDAGLGCYLQRFLGDAMGLASGRKWTNIRKAFRVPLSPATADASLANIEASLDQWEEETLEPLARSGLAVTVPEVVAMMPITVMLNIFFGHKFVRRHSAELARLTEDADVIMKTALYNRLACTSLYRHLPTGPNRTLASFQQSWAGILQSYETSKERKEGEGGAIDSVIDFMNSSQAGSITFSEVADTMSEIIFTNQDVLSPAISWLLTDLLVYPHQAQALQLASTYGLMDRATLQDHQPHLLNLIKESARVHLFFPLSIPEVLSKDVQLGGFSLMAGTTVSIDQYSINMNPQYWHEPSTFRPERFEDSDAFRDKWSLFRFGFGARRCPGQHYGNLVLANVTARLLARWRLVPVGLEGVTHHELVPMVPGNFAMMPDIKVRLEDSGENKNDLQNIAKENSKMEAQDLSSEVKENSKNETRDVSFESKENNIKETKKVSSGGKESIEKISKNVCSEGKVNNEKETSDVSSEGKENNKNKLKDCNQDNINALRTPLLGEVLRSVKPTFREGSCVTDLLTTHSVVGVSTLPGHPLLLPGGSHQLVSFLAALPLPSIIVLGDSLNKHNIKAMWKNGNRPPTDEKALSLALEAGEPFRQSLGTAIEELEAGRPERRGWITLLGWQDVEGEELREQQRITRNYYDCFPPLRLRIDEIATKFLVHRRPHSKNHTARLPHMVAYLLDELPWLVTGTELEGVHYTALLYPTSMAGMAKGGTLANAMWDLTHDIHTTEEFAAFRQDITRVSRGREVLPGVVLLPIDTAEEERSLYVGEKLELEKYSFVQEKRMADQSCEEAVEMKIRSGRIFKRQVSSGGA